MASKNTSPAINGSGKRKPPFWTGSLSREDVPAVLDYNPETGIFTWRVRVSKACKAGDVAGTLTNDGYIYITIKGYRYQAHRLAWFIVYDDYVMPDHKNKIRHDNRIENLRPATYSQNGANRPKKGQYKGVTQRGNRWIAQITINYRNHYLGMFKTPEKAAAVYRKVAKRVWGEYASE